MADAVTFIRKNGRVIPIRAAKSVSSVASSGISSALIKKSKSPSIKKPDLKVNKKLDSAGVALSVASGAIAAATFGTPKGFLAGHAIAHGLDVVGVGANAASVAGKGHSKERAIQATKQEARNFAIGNAVYFAGVFGLKRNRQAAAGYIKKGAEVAQKILAFSRKALRVA